MPEQWPAALSNVKPQRSGFNYEKASNKAEAAFDSGRGYAKRTNFKTPDRFRCGLLFDEQQYSAFLSFWEASLNEGIETFFWSHPLTSQRIEARFIGAYDLAERGPGLWRVRVFVEVVNLL